VLRARRLVAPATALALLLLSGTARAATVTVAPDPDTMGYDEVRYIAAPGERNRVLVGYAADARSVTVSDPGAVITASAPCRSIDAHTAVCVKRPQSTVEWLQHTRLDLGDLDDQLRTTRPTPYPIGGVTADGGPGDDLLDGGAGADRLDGGGGHDEVLGGALDDVLTDGDTDAGAGPDLMDGGPGPDTVSYAQRRRPVSVTVGDDAPDGAPGEGDVVRGVEHATGGAGDDRLVGDDRANTLAGGPGADLLLGRGRSDLLDGGRGRDRLRGATGDDRLNSGPGRDALTCGSGADVVGEPAAGEAMGRDCETLLFHLDPDSEDALTVPTHPRAGRGGAVTFRMSCPDLETSDGELSACRGTLTVREAAGPKRLLGSGRIADEGEHRGFPVRLRLTAAGGRVLTRRGAVVTVRIRGQNLPRRAWTIRL
jgi:Ca2+-binding RTX toxin-like protein